MSKNTKAIIIIVAIITILYLIIFLLSIYESNSIKNRVVLDNSNSNDTVTTDIRDYEPTDIPVSNSGDAPASSFVFSPFYVLNTEDTAFTMSYSGDFRIDKITTYERYLRYKERWGNLRELTREDFIHYYLLLAVVTNDASNIYTVKGMENTDILVQKINKHPNVEELAYTGIAIIIPNTNDMEESEINIIDVDSSDYIYDQRAENIDKDIFETDFAQFENLPINTDIKISVSQAKKNAEKAFDEGFVNDFSIEGDIKIDNVTCNNYFTRKSDEGSKTYSKRKAYIITKYKYPQDEDFVLNPGIMIYVDVTTGKVIGLKYFGDN